MYLKLILSILVYSFLTSCSSVKNVEPIKIKDTKVLLFKGPPPKKGVFYAYPTALFQGYLVQKGNCLYLSQKPNSKIGLVGIIWPWNYSLSIIENKLIIKDGSHRNIATVGAFVKLGGGYTTSEIIKNYDQCSSFKVKEVFAGYSLQDIK